MLARAEEEGNTVHIADAMAGNLEGGLAQVLAKHGKCDAVRAMLAHIYNWFTEGFDTTDLNDAKVLLGELSGAPAESQYT